MVNFIGGLGIESVDTTTKPKPICICGCNCGTENSQDCCTDAYDTAHDGGSSTPQLD